jgi:N-acetylglucosaminyl-diphospho-decaprenol L-rhamnosyltransferase
MTNNPNRFSIVIPVFNQISYTSQCIESLLAEQVRPEQILIIDNASTDETWGWLGQHPEVRRHRNRVNLGCGCAWTQGAVMSPDAEWVVFLNNDVLSGPRAIHAMIDAAEREKFGVVSPALLEGPNDYGFESFSKEYQKKMAGIVRRGLFHGACFAVHRSVFEKIGFPDTDRRLGGYEDAEYLIRCKRAGIPFGMVGESVLHHFGSITQKAMVKKVGESLGDRKYFRARVGIGLLSRKRDKFRFQSQTRQWVAEELKKTGFTLHMLRQNGQWELL